MSPSISRTRPAIPCSSSRRRPFTPSCRRKRMRSAWSASWPAGWPCSLSSACSNRSRIAREAARHVALLATAPRRHVPVVLGDGRPAVERRGRPGRRARGSGARGDGSQAPALIAAAASRRTRRRHPIAGRLADGAGALFGIVRQPRPNGGASARRRCRLPGRRPRLGRPARAAGRRSVRVSASPVQPGRGRFQRRRDAVDDADGPAVGKDAPGHVRLSMGLGPGAVAVVLPALAWPRRRAEAQRRTLGLSRSPSVPISSFTCSFRRPRRPGTLCRWSFPSPTRPCEGSRRLSPGGRGRRAGLRGLQRIRRASRRMYWYSRVEAPAFQMLDDMQDIVARSLARAGDASPRRARSAASDPLGGVAALDARLPSPPKHEWLEVVKYWNGGGRQPVWFVADPPRSDLALFRRQRPPVRYRWPFDIPLVMGGVRPNEMDWYMIDPPDWYLGEGWAVTPETAGVARETGAARDEAAFKVGCGAGRAGDADGWRTKPGKRGAGTCDVAVDGRPVDEGQSGAGILPADAHASRGQPDRDRRLRHGTRLPPTAIRSPSSSSTHSLKAGSCSATARDGTSWSTTRRRAGCGAGRPNGPRCVSGPGAARSRCASTGRSRRTTSSHVVVRVGDRLVAEQQVGRVFSMSAAMPAGLVGPDGARRHVETSAWYVPGKQTPALARSTPPRAQDLLAPARAGFLARQRSELPTGLSNTVNHQLSTRSTPSAAR